MAGCLDTPSPAALRQLRYRQRQQQGVQLIRDEVDQDLIESLLVRRFLRVEDIGDVKAIARAILKVAG